jgi:hypothetical protein
VLTFVACYFTLPTIVLLFHHIIVLCCCYYWIAISCSCLLPCYLTALLLHAPICHCIATSHFRLLLHVLHLLLFAPTISHMFCGICLKCLLLFLPLCCFVAWCLPCVNWYFPSPFSCLQMKEFGASNFFH